MRTIIIVLLIIVICPGLICAQQISIPSPTAANLGLYGEIPVSYYTGTPDISIPLYEIKGKHITCPVRLTYHPSGIRPEIHPGPVGLGWSLQAGGVITRTVRGNSPDESEYISGSVAGYLQYANGWMAQNDWKDNAKNALNDNCFACRNTVHNMAPYSDFEPDEFNFSVLGLSGKFYFDHTGQIQVQCDRPAKVIFNNEFVKPSNRGIELDYSNNYEMHRAFESFTIIDEHGTQFEFGGVNAIEFSDPISYGRNIAGYGIPATGQLLQANSWFLTSIKSADGADVISFEYERGPFVCQLYRSFNGYSYSGPNGSGWAQNSINIDGTLISPVYLVRITRLNGEEIRLKYSQSNDLKYTPNNYNSIFSNASIYDYKLLDNTNAIPRFQPSPPSNKLERIQWLKLDSILIQRTVFQRIKQINLFYNNSPAERLFLDSLSIHGLNGETSTSPMNYSFTYKNKNRLPAQYLTCITDHWGFNNGKTFATSGFNVQNKTPNSYYTDSGVLSEVQYPTGGKTQFEYELHDYAKVVNTKNRSEIVSQLGTASGLRIRKITSDNLIREFFYKETPSSSISSGILNILPQYSYTISGTDCDNSTFTKSIIRSMPVIPLTKDNEGLFVGYSYVCEKVYNGNGGYTQYHYTNHDDGHSDILLANGTWHRDIFPSDPHCSRFFERGRLIKETSYNNAGQVVAVSKTVWSRYGSQGEDNPRAFFFGGIAMVSPNGLNWGYDYCSSTAYLHFCYKFLPSQRTDTIFSINGQNPVVTTTNYEYNLKRLVKATTVTNSDMSVLRKELKYPSDFQASPYPDMVTKHILSPVVETSLLKNNSLIEKTGSDYTLQYNTFYAPTNFKYQKGGETMEIKETYQYDTKRNVIEVTRDGNDKMIYLWSYLHQYPIAKIQNGSYTFAQIEDVVKSVFLVTNLEALSRKMTPNETILKSGRLQDALPNALVTTYTYLPHIGMTSQTDAAGRTTYYEYDDFGRLDQIKNADGDIVKKYYYHYYNQTTSDGEEDPNDPSGGEEDPNDPSDPDLYFSVSPSFLRFMAYGGMQSFTIESNTDWTITQSPTWVTLSKTSGSGNATIIVTCSSYSSSMRSDVIVIQSTSEGTLLSTKALAILQNY